MLARLFLSLLLLAPVVDAQPSPLETWEGEITTDRWPIFMTLNLGAEPSASSIAFLGQTFKVKEIHKTAENVEIVPDGAGFKLEGRMAGDRFVGSLIEGTAVLPFAFDRVAHLPSPKNRIERWSQDLDALSTRFIRYDRSFSSAERALFLEKLDWTRARLSKLDDDQVRMEMASAIAIANNAHTRLYLLRNRTELRRLPVRLWWFRDGLRVVRATPEHRDLLGCRVDDIGGKDVRHVRDIVGTAFAGNPSWRDYKSVYSMTSPEALRGFGIIENPESVPFGLSDCAVSRVSIKPLPLLKKTSAVEAWWDLSPLHEDSDRVWAHALDGSKGTLPVYLRNPTRHYWFEFLPATGTLYFQYNRSAPWPGEPLDDFTNRLLGEFDKHPVKSVVVDLRFNTGGNLNLATDLFTKLRERAKEIPKFVITGRATFSAGISHAASWRLPGITFVGEPVGDDLDMWAEGGNIILPNSRLAAHFSNGAHSYSTEPCPQGVACLDLSVPSLGPDIPVTSSWQEYRDGRDPAMEAIALSMR